MNRLSDEIEEILNDLDFYAHDVGKQDGEYYVEINNSTPAGEDWWETVWFDGSMEDFTDKVMERANDFDVDEEVEVWIESRGKNGVPSSIRALVEDAEWKKQQLIKLANTLENAIYC